MALRQKREFSSPSRLSHAPPAPIASSDTVLSPDSYLSGPPLPTLPSLSSVNLTIDEAIQRWTMAGMPVSPVVTRSSSNYSLGSAYQALLILFRFSMPFP